MRELCCRRRPSVHIRASRAASTAARDGGGMRARGSPERGTGAGCGRTSPAARDEPYARARGGRAAVRAGEARPPPRLGSALTARARAAVAFRLPAGMSRPCHGGGQGPVGPWRRVRRAVPAPPRYGTAVTAPPLSAANQSVSASNLPGPPPGPIPFLVHMQANVRVSSPVSIPRPLCAWTCDLLYEPGSSRGTLSISLLPDGMPGTDSAQDMFGSALDMAVLAGWPP